MHRDGGNFVLGDYGVGDASVTAMYVVWGMDIEEPEGGELWVEDTEGKDERRDGKGEKVKGTAHKVPSGEFVILF